MILGYVEGTVVASQKDAGLTGFKLLLIRHVDRAMKPTGSYTIAVDAIGAGDGEMVLVVSGSSARMAEQTLNKPVDASVIAIVDNVVLEGIAVYEKGAASAAAAATGAGSGRR
jgi:microcompartment protein CcmK/EutM